MQITVLPSLKPSVDKALRSRIVYKINCSRCNACYVGQTDRHLHKRFKEHLRISQPVGLHLKLCGVTAHFDNEEEVSILQCTSRNVAFLETLEALWQRDLKPKINTRDEFRKRELTIRLQTTRYQLVVYLCILSESIFCGFYFIRF